MKICKEMEFSCYLVLKVHINSTYSLRKLDETTLHIHVTGKRVKAFKMRDGRFCNEDLDDFMVLNHEID